MFLTDFRYVEQAEDEVDPGFDRRGERDLLEDGRKPCPSAARSARRRRQHLGAHPRRLRELLGDQVELVAAGA